MINLKEVLPEDIADILIEAGYDTPDKILKASKQELLSIGGIRRAAIPKIIESVRDPLDVALDPFVPVAEAFAKAWKKDYPDTAKLIDIDENVLTVGDFRKLYKSLRKEK
jgi:hypothetical protein